MKPSDVGLQFDANALNHWQHPAGSFSVELGDATATPIRWSCGSNRTIPATMNAATERPHPPLRLLLWIPAQQMRPCWRTAATAKSDALWCLQTTITQLERWHQHTPPVVLGDGTSSKAWQQQLQHLAPMRIVKEAGTTLRARERYWQIWPARGWRRLLPQGLRLPPSELDGIAALVLLEDQLHQPLTWLHPPKQGAGLRTVPAR